MYTIKSSTSTYLHARSRDHSRKKGGHFTPNRRPRTLIQVKRKGRPWWQCPQAAALMDFILFLSPSRARPAPRAEGRNTLNHRTASPQRRHTMLRYCTYSNLASGDARVRLASIRSINKVHVLYVVEGHPSAVGEILAVGSARFSLHGHRPRLESRDHEGLSQPRSRSRSRRSASRGGPPWRWV
jgi:hypothetical protein